MADAHSDTVARVEQPAPTSATPTLGKPTKRIDNTDQAALAEHQRERSFSTGGDDPAAAPAAPAAPAVAIQRLDAAIHLVRTAGRPSPFGVSQFPPLPLPPGTKP
jgi:hypothetical protein